MGSSRPPFVEPIHPVEGFELNVFAIASRPETIGYLGLIQSDHRLGKGVVVRIADAAHRGFDAGFRQAFTSCF